jgi:dephospho-CoA kinase
MVVIGLVGKLCSGKQLFCEICKEDFNFQLIDLDEDFPMENLIKQVLLKENFT